MSEGACFYRGTSMDQCSQFGDTDTKLVKQMEKNKQFPDNYKEKVNMKKVSLDVIKPWVRKRITELMGLEDDIVIEYALQQLEENNMGIQNNLDPKSLQLNLTPFMERKAKIFCSELWTHLLSAQESPIGVPQSFIDLKKQELQAKKDKANKIQEELDRRRAALQPQTTTGFSNQSGFGFAPSMSSAEGATAASGTSIFDKAGSKKRNRFDQTPAEASKEAAIEQAEQEAADNLARIEAAQAIRDAQVKEAEAKRPKFDVI